MNQRGRGAEMGKDGRDIHGAPFVSANCIRFDEFDLSPLRWGTPASWNISRSYAGTSWHDHFQCRGFTKQGAVIKVCRKYLDGALILQRPRTGSHSRL